MGIKVPQPIAPEPPVIPNPVFPPDETPYIIWVRIDGMVNDRRDIWPDLDPSNGVYNCKQISSTQWQFYNIDINVTLTLSTSGVNVVLIRGLWEFMGGSSNPFSMKVPNTIISGPMTPIIGGFASWLPYPFFEDYALELGIPLEQKTFGELQGADVRLVQQSQGTCVYYRKG